MSAITEIDRFNPFPAADGSAGLHLIYRKNIKESLGALVIEAARSLARDYQKQITFINKLDADQYFSPSIYHFYYTLLATMVNNQIELCEELCENLIEKLSENPLYLSGLNVATDYQCPLSKMMVTEILNDNKSFSPEILTQDEINRNKTAINEALKLIADAYKEMATELNDHLHWIQLSKGDSFGYSGSSAIFFGGFSIKIPDASTNHLLYYFDLIIHELSHLHLNLLMSFDPIIMNPPDEMHFSPARGTNRPIKGIYHAHFVFFRLVINYLKAYKFFTEKDEILIRDSNVSNKLRTIPWVFKKRLNDYLFKFEQNEAILKEHAKFTEIGLKQFNLMSESYHKLVNECGFIK